MQGTYGILGLPWLQTSKMCSRPATKPLMACARTARTTNSWLGSQVRHQPLQLTHYTYTSQILIHLRHPPVDVIMVEFCFCMFHDRGKLNSALCCHCLVSGIPSPRMSCRAMVFAAADGAQYLRDTCITLCYFLQAYPPGSQLLLQGHPIITHLTMLHDDLIPQMAKSVTAAAQHHHPQAPQVESLALYGIHAAEMWVLLLADVNTGKRLLPVSF